MVTAEADSLFWGLCLEAGGKYSQTVEKAFHVSMAALDPRKCKGSEPISLFLQKNKVDYVLCTLVPGTVNQQQLDLNFTAGEEITLFTREKGTVHLTGYLIEEEDMDYDSEGGEDEDEEEAEEEAVEKVVKKSTEGKIKQSEITGDEDDDNDVSMEEEPPKKKAKKDKKEKIDKKEKVEVSDTDKKTPEGETVIEKKKKKKKKKNKNAEDAKDEKPSAEKPKKRTAKGGVVVEDIKEGHGPAASNGKLLKLYYTGRLSNGKVFDSTTSGSPFSFKLGKKEVIPGWDIGLEGMKVGGKRRLTIPPSMAYGNTKAGNIPPNSTLTFEVELKSVA